MPLRVLVADDAADIVEIVAFGARMSWPGCQVAIAANGQDALRCFQQERPDIVVLDVSMPPPDGFEVCRRIREASSVPILMLSVRGATLDKVRALDYGADDYVIKPFDPVELLARLRALLRRAQNQPVTSGERFVAGALTVDFRTHQVALADEVVRLTSTEYRLLEQLVRNAGAVVPTEMLLERVWGEDRAADAGYVKVFVRRLRQKLGDDRASPQFIHTEWGVGYRFSPS